MVSDSVRDARSSDFLGLPRHAPETSGKECLLGPFWDLFGTLPRPCLGAVWYYVVYPAGYTPGPKAGKMEALRPLLPILASFAKVHKFFSHAPGNLKFAPKFGP